jgi:NMD protein affecting ribosome stability and mRNA decay
MNGPIQVQRYRLHRHRAVVSHVLGQRSGVPYELERSVCKTCGRELAVRPVKRAFAA